jgi:3-dehydroquinate dehydratase
LSPKRIKIGTKLSSDPAFSRNKVNIEESIINYKNSPAVTVQGSAKITVHLSEIVKDESQKQKSVISPKSTANQSIKSSIIPN